jgi:anthranilate phosphoribosyltransferase
VTIQETIRHLVLRRDLSEQQASAVLERLMAGEATPAQVGALLVALRMKGETLAEIAGFVRTARAAARSIHLTTANVIDTCGTGGDGVGTFNVSTVAAFVAAGAGCKVAKHGNRSNLSRCGSADVLEALQVDVHMPPEETVRCIDEIGIGFLFAPDYHPGARHVIGPRRDVGIRTIFNAMGPLVNPSGCQRQLMGVYDVGLTEPIATVLGQLGSRHALIVHGEDGLDEISINAATRVSELKSGVVSNFTIEPEEFRIPRAPLSAVMGGDSDKNTAILLAVLGGQAGPPRDLVVLNAGAAIYVAGLATSIQSGIEAARHSIDCGRARRVLDELVRRSAAGRKP